MEIENEIRVSASPNNSQIHAIQTTECPLLIIAGLGLGKTFTLAAGAFYLIAMKTISQRKLE